MHTSFLSNAVANAGTRNTKMHGLVDIRYAHRCLSKQQVEAAHNSVTASKHTKITLMPNHSLNIEGELEGFVFECSADDPASVLPLSKKTFSTTAIYECVPDNGSTYQQAQRQYMNVFPIMEALINSLR